MRCAALVLAVGLLAIEHTGVYGSGESSQLDEPVWKWPCTSRWPAQHPFAGHQPCPRRRQVPYHPFGGEKVVERDWAVGHTFILAVPKLGRRGPLLPLTQSRTGLYWNYTGSKELSPLIAKKSRRRGALTRADRLRVAPHGHREGNVCLCVLWSISSRASRTRCSR